MTRPSRARPTAPAGATGGSILVPCVMLRRGQVCVPGPDGPQVAHDGRGAPFDPFDVVDRLRPDYSRLYLVDLDGIERGVPQLAYLQELSRDVSLWVDAGVPTAEAAIDILVAGAERAVLSTAFLRGPTEVRRAWKLSTDWVVELELSTDGTTIASDAWPTRDAPAIAASVRAVGVSDIVLSAREHEPDWAMVAALASNGPTWVAGSFSVGQLPRLRASGAAGGIFHIDGFLERPPPASDPDPRPLPSASPRDDEE